MKQFAIVTEKGIDIFVDRYDSEEEARFEASND